MKNFFIGIWNWIKSLFASCFGYQDQPAQETDSLLVPDAPPTQESPPIVERKNSSSVIFAAIHEPVTLSDQETKIILYYAHKGENLYIDNLTPEKKTLAYELIRKEVNANINIIDNEMTSLQKLDPTANRLQSSWRRVRADFSEGESSEFNITPTCQKMLAGASDERASILDNIIRCFNICKTLLKLAICKQEVVKRMMPRIPTADEIKLTAKLTESRMNAKTLEIVEKFNKSGEEDEHEKEKQPSRRRRFTRGKHNF